MGAFDGIVVNRTEPSAPRCDYNRSNNKNCRNVVFHSKYGQQDIRDLKFKTLHSLSWIS